MGQSFAGSGRVGSEKGPVDNSVVRWNNLSDFCECSRCELKVLSLWPSGIGSRLGREQVVSSIPDSVEYITYIVSLSLQLLGSLWGSLGTYGLTQKLC